MKPSISTLKPRISSSWRIQPWTNSQQLQQWINNAENTPITEQARAGEYNLDEMYVKATLGNLQQSQPEESKFLGVRWSRYSDKLFFNVTEMHTRLAGSLQSTKPMNDLQKYLLPVIVPFRFLF